MNKQLKSELLMISQELRRQLSPELIEQIGRNNGFVQRKSKFRTQDLASLCIWLSHKLASDSLVQLCGALESEIGIRMSAEGLNQRLNNNAVKSLTEIFISMLACGLNDSASTQIFEQKVFNRIRIMDSTTFQLPDSFVELYPGSGGSSNTAGVKIHLEYDLLSGKFLNIYSGAGSKNDKTYGTACLSSVRPGDLFIRDLGYFDLTDLNTINEQSAFFVSRVKLNTRVYIKNPQPKSFENGSITKSSEYIQIDLENILDQLNYAQTLEIPLVYCGMKQKLPARLICYRLTEQQYQNRRKKQNLTEKKKQIKLKEKSKHLSGMNIYITNIPHELITKEQIHDIYSLRWQIEIVFKTWKSFFKIQQCKKIKTERLECHLYGQLIAILITSSISYKMRALLYRRRLEISEYKCFYIVNGFLYSIYRSISKNTQVILKLLFRLFGFLRQNGRKSHRYDKKTAFDILSVCTNISMDYQSKAIV